VKFEADQETLKMRPLLVSRLAAGQLHTHISARHAQGTPAREDARRVRTERDLSRTA
jgi:hypothetical protein